MSPQAVLGDFEQLVLLAVLQADRDAYGVAVWREIAERAGREVSLGAVYKTLERLETKGLAASHVGEPTAERGGRRKRVFAVTPSGLRVLRDILDASSRMQAGLERQLGLEVRRLPR